jgi:hypothetical protein
VSKKLEIDFETADRIAVLTMKEQRKYLKKELADFKQGQYLHPEDVSGNQIMIHHLDAVIKHFGG